jgi:hypothetical protein
VREKYTPVIKALYSNISGRVRAYGTLSAPFTISSGVRQGCGVSPLLFNFVIDDILETAFGDSDISGIELFPGRNLLDLEYADDIVLICDSAQACQNAVDRLASVIRQFGMCFSPSKCKVLLQDRHEPVPDFTLNGDTLEVVERFVYLGGCFSTRGLQDEITNRIAKARAAFANLRHLWRRHDVSIRLKGRVYNAAVRSVLLYGCETWPLRSQDIQRLSVFDHRCLRSIAHVWWDQRVSNDCVRYRVFGAGNRSEPLSAIISRIRLRWLGHVLCMDENRLPRLALFCCPGVGWKKPRGGQSMTWRRGMKALTKRLASVGPCRLPGWGPKESDHAWLVTLSDMAQNRPQWRSCCDFLCSV